MHDHGLHRAEHFRLRREGRDRRRVPLPERSISGFRITTRRIAPRSSGGRAIPPALRSPTCRRSRIRASPPDDAARGGARASEGTGRRAVLNAALFAAAGRSASCSPTGVGDGRYPRVNLGNILNGSLPPSRAIKALLTTARGIEDDRAAQGTAAEEPARRAGSASAAGRARWIASSATSRRTGRWSSFRTPRSRRRSSPSTSRTAARRIRRK